MTPNVGGKACLALTMNKELREIFPPAALLFASLAILAPLATAQQRGGDNPANLNFDAMYSGGLSSCSYFNPDKRNCDPVEFSHDSGGAVACAKEENFNCGRESVAALERGSGDDSKNQPSDERLHGSDPGDFNRDIYYKNKLEFSLEGGWFPINIPFAFDVFEGDAYNLYPLRYTLVPIMASLRWHMDDIYGPWILRGNWDLTCTGSYTAIPRGAETRYYSYIMGIRRNFIPRNWRIAPYWDIRLGLGDIDARGPDGVRYAQGQDFTFTANMGSGVRYNFNPRYAISAGLNYMHISNAGLSEPKVPNYGINVYGPMVGIDIQLRRHKQESEQ